MIAHCSMKIPLLAAALSLAIAAATHAQPSSAKQKTPAPDSPKFTLQWFQPTTPELTAYEREASSIARRQKVGEATQEQLEAALARVEHAQKRTPYLLNIESLGGTLAEFASLASRASEMSLTVINAGEPADLQTVIPPFTLRNAHWGTVVNVLATFLEMRGLDFKLVGGDNPNLSEARSIVCMLRRIQPAPGDKNRAPSMDFDSIQLHEHIHGTQTIDVIVDAIRTAWELDPTRDAAALRLKFHPPTKLLLISGPAPAGAVVHRVIGGLRKNPVQR